jgi:hypothetical protein
VLSTAVPDVAAEIVNLEQRRPANQLRPGSIAAIAADLGKIDRGAPIDRQAEAFMAVTDRLGKCLQEKVTHASKRASDRYWRRYKTLLDAQQVRISATPTGLLAVFKRKAFEAANAAYTLAFKLEKQAAALSHNLSRAEWTEAVKERTWAKLATAAPDLTECVKFHRSEVERRELSERLERDQRGHQAKRDRKKGPRLRH